MKTLRKRIKKTVKRIANNWKTKGLYEAISWELFGGKQLAPKETSWN